jgi:DNA invertase Pin-like site-specific DNA recombinase
VGFARQNNLKVGEFVEITFSSRKSSRQRQIDALRQRVADPDRLMVADLSRLGRNTSEIIDLINELVQRNVRTIIIKQNLDIFKCELYLGCGSEIPATRRICSQ